MLISTFIHNSTFPIFVDKTYAHFRFQRIQVKSEKSILQRVCHLI
jgi:hypothetical protein